MSRACLWDSEEASHSEGCLENSKKTRQRNGFQTPICFWNPGGAANRQDGFMRLGWHDGDWWKTKWHEKEQTQSEMNNRRYGGGFHTIDNEWCIRYTNRMFLSGPLDLYMWYHLNNKPYNSGSLEYRLGSLLRVTFGRWQRRRIEISYRTWLILRNYGLVVAESLYDFIVLSHLTI